jgi:hypothetical protein
MSAESPATPPRVVVTFHGGPCEGTVVLGEGKTPTHATAAMAYRRYRECPPAIGGHVWGGMCESDEPVDYYTIAHAGEVDGRIEMVCEYEGSRHPPKSESE